MKRTKSWNKRKQLKTKRRIKRQQAQSRRGK